MNIRLTTRAADLATDRTAESLAHDVIKLREERDALAAHVERMRDVWQRLHLRSPAHVEVLKAYSHVMRDTPTTSLARHPDDVAVDRFASAMKAKLADARARGRDGWGDPDRCGAELLADLLVGHVGKGNAGNLEDIANLAMMLHQRGDDPAAVAQALARLKAEWVEKILETLPYKDLHTNNGDMRKDAHYRDGWNSFRDQLRRQSEELAE